MRLIRDEPLGLCDVLVYPNYDSLPGRRYNKSPFLLEASSMREALDAFLWCKESGIPSRILSPLDTEVIEVSREIQNLQGYGFEFRVDFSDGECLAALELFEGDVGDIIVPTLEDVEDAARFYELRIVMDNCTSVAHAVRAAMAGARGVIVDGRRAGSFTLIQKVREALPDFEMYVDNHPPSRVPVTYAATAGGTLVYGWDPSSPPAMTDARRSLEESGWGEIDLEGSPLYLERGKLWI